MMNIVRTNSNQIVIEDIGQELRNQFSYINFDLANHLYTDQYGVNYHSVSSVLEKFVHPFDLEHFSKKVAEREKTSQDEIKTLWDIRRNYSMVRGTEFHLYVQTFLSTNRQIEILTPIQKEINSFHRFWDKIKDRFEVIATELIVADNEYKIAGTIDCIARNLDSGEFFIFDWKTNRKITDKNPINKKMLPPLDHIEHCHLNKYSLQMGMYKYLLNKNTKLNIEKIHIVHFSPNGEYKFYNPRSLEEEVKTIINVHTQGQSTGN